MIGIIVLTHGDLAKEVINTAESAAGHQEGLEAVCFSGRIDPEDLGRETREAIKRRDEGEGVILLTDTYGSTCSNIARSVLEDNGNRHRIEIVTGVNLPMLLDLIMSRDKLSLKEAAKKAEQAGKKAIVNVRETLKDEESYSHPE